jgi:hypothetical protein
VSQAEQQNPWICLFHYIRPVLIATAYCLPVLFMAHSIVFWGRGVIDMEAISLVPHYLDSRSFLAQIFDPNSNDARLYQARELSYFFDLIDARVFAALLNAGILLFVPLSGVIGLISLSAIYFWGARTVLRLKGETASLLLTLFLSSIVIQASTSIFYRSSKIVMSVMLITFLFYLLYLLRDELRGSAPLLKWVGLFLLGFVMSLCDRQGFFYLVSTTIFILIVWLIAIAKKKDKRQNRYLLAFLVSVCAVGASALYNHLLAPHIIYFINGYWPNFFYQRLSLTDLLDPTLPGKAWDMFRRQVSYFSGNIPFTVLCLIGGIAWLRRIWKQRGVKLTDSGFQILLVAAFSSVMLVALLVVMIARHAPIYEIPDHSFWYYTLSIHVVILFVVSVCLSWLEQHQRLRRKSAFYLVLLILIASNTWHYPEQRQTMIHSTEWFGYQYQQSQMLVQQFATSPPQHGPLPPDSNLWYMDQRQRFLQTVQLLHDERTRGKAR